jgi:hypothetical protein
MAMDGTYGGLKASIADWLNRQDLTAVVPDYITLLEAQLNRTLRTRDMLVRSDASISAEYTALPADYLEARNLIIFGSSGDPHVVDVKTPEEVQIEQLNTPTGQPSMYSVIGSTIEVAPIPDGTYPAELLYYGQIPSLLALSNAGAGNGATNWLLTKCPDLYLYGSLMQAAPYLKDDDRVEIWGNAVTAILNDMRVESERAILTGNQKKLQIRPFGMPVRTR